MTAEVKLTSTAVRLSQEQRKELASALRIDLKFVPEEISVLGVPRGASELRTGIPMDRAGQFSPALVLM